MEKIYISKNKYLFYCKLCKQTPNSKLLYHFPSRSLVLALKDYYMERAVELPILEDVNSLTCSTNQKPIEFKLIKKV